MDGFESLIFSSRHTIEVVVVAAVVVNEVVEAEITTMTNMVDLEVVVVEEVEVVTQLRYVK